MHNSMKFRLLLFVFLSATIMIAAQNVSQDEILTKGMIRIPQGQAPFGLTSSGQPNWPIDDSKWVPSESSDQNTSARSKTAKEALAVKPSVPTQVKPNTTALQKMAKTDAKSTSASGTAKGSLTAQEIATFKKAFLRDCVRHARALYSGKDADALKISLKWNTLAHLYPDQIDEVTQGVASKLGYRNFHEQISATVNADWEAAKKSPAPTFLTDGITTSPTKTPTSGSTSSVATLPAEKISKISGNLAESIMSKLSITSMNSGQLENVTNSLDLEGSAARQPVLEIIEEVTGNRNTELLDLQNAAVSADMIGQLGDKMIAKIQQIQGSTVSSKIQQVIKGLASGIAARIKKEVDDMLR